MKSSSPDNPRWAKILDFLAEKNKDPEFDWCIGITFSCKTLAAFITCLEVTCHFCEEENNHPMLEHLNPLRQEIYEYLEGIIGAESAKTVH